MTRAQDCEPPQALPHHWTNVEIQFLRDHYKKYGAQYIADYLHRSVASVYKTAYRLGIKKKRRIE